MDEMKVQYVSGRGAESTVPPEIRKWNWGAFWLNGVWGIGNSTFIGLLMFIPIVNFVMPFVLGAKGSEWAWRNRVWLSVDHFKKVQRQWAIAGFVSFFIIGLLALIPLTIFQRSEPYKMSVEQVINHPEMKALLGDPIIASRFVSGNMQMNHAEAHAGISYKVKGPNGSARVYVYAFKRMGTWVLDEVAARVIGEDYVIWIIEGD